MRLLEYQAKWLFRQYGLPVPRYQLIYTPLGAKNAAQRINAETFVLKAQIASDGRTRAGGIKIVDTPLEAEDYASTMLGTRLVTQFNEPRGQLIESMLIEQTCEVVEEIYLGVQIDPITLKPVLFAARESETDRANEVDMHSGTAGSIAINQRTGVLPYQVRSLGRRLKLSTSLTDQLVPLMQSLSYLVMENDFRVIEINPLAVTSDGHLLCLNGKIITQSHRGFAGVGPRYLIDN